MVDRLWAPWRMGYIAKHSDAAPCFLCAAVKGRQDKLTHVLARSRTCFAILNRYPYATGHVMVTPNAHRADIADLTSTESRELMSLAARVKGAITRAFKPEGFNLGINLGRVAGAGLLGHVHMHLVPRWNGDTNFMPVTANVRVMPMTLPQVAAALRKELRR